ncbi:type IX secretion system PorP/SprF family membrane protein [Catalinimonas alkaloidigena]|uniref:PorP/SprF family type IX secretion system membrane protein n=1 Tax=Catalinimonas alkaloidigena TaxID=1075417 RepID=UPI002405623D|nr:PorP/SprF family type IX secretion system membrane protein [Catalinimonas alkaloidigena]MDF9797551.1 type IX secretion system PorP/SprF family membrane protein [Catalinimonas alkaloidigena]
MRIAIIIFLVFLTHCVFAQTPPLSHYPLSPSLFNPAYIGQKGKAEIVLNHKQQWVGINNAPSISNFQLSLPVIKPISIGIRAQRFTRGAINTNNVNALFSYHVPFGINTGLTFGLAGGIQKSGIEKNSTFNLSDPAVVAYSDTPILPDLKFGLSYRYQQLNLGVSFTEMLKSDIYGSTLAENKDVKFYENYIVNLDYKFKFPASKLIVQPFMLYTASPISRSYFEAGSLLRLQDLIYIGGSFREDYGISILTGFENEKFSFGYAYELASNLVNSIGQGSHELQVSYRFGKALPIKKEKKKKEEPQIEKESEQAAPTEEDNTLAEAIPTNEEDVTTNEDEFYLLENTTAHTVYHRGKAGNELPIGFYVIAGAYHSKESADNRTVQLSRQNLFAANAYNSESKLYLVFVYRTEFLEKAKTARDSFIKKASLKDAWLLEIREKD